MTSSALVASTDSVEQSRGETRNEGDVAEWDVLDFYGKYHLPYHEHSRNRVRAKHPIPGTAIKRDQAIRAARAAVQEEREERLKALTDQYEHRVARKVARERMVINSMFQTRVGDVADRFETFLEHMEEEQPGIDVHEPESWHVKFFAAARKGVVPVCLSAIDQHGVDPNSRDSTLGNTALHYAVSKGHIDLCDVLLQAGANPNTPSRLGAYPIHRVWDMMAGHGRNVNQFLSWEKINKLLRLLLRAGAEPDVATQDGTCAIHLAAKYGPANALVMLLEFKAEHRVVDAHGQTAKDIAARHGHDVSVRMLTLWDSIRDALGHLDFEQQWRRFCADTTRPMDLTDDTQKLLFNLHLQQTKELKELEGGPRMLKLDDDALRQLLKDMPLHERLQHSQGRKDAAQEAGKATVHQQEERHQHQLAPHQQIFRLRDRRARMAELVGQHGDFSRAKLYPEVASRSSHGSEPGDATATAATPLSLKHRLAARALPNGGSSLASMLTRVNEQEHDSGDGSDSPAVQQSRPSDNRRADHHAVTGTRKAFVSERLLPPAGASSYLDRLRKQFKKAEEAAEQADSNGAGAGGGKEDVMARLTMRREQAHSQKAALLKATQDAGRLVSALSIKGPLQYPWE